MPRLVNIGAGEIVDRLTILSLKILYSGLRGKPPEHFENERNALLSMMAKREKATACLEQMLMLGAVNGALWQAEDELRGYRAKRDLTGDKLHKNDSDATVQAAFRIQQLNDSRAELVEAINKLAGEHLGTEKL